MQTMAGLVLELTTLGQSDKIFNHCVMPTPSYLMSSCTHFGEPSETTLRKWRMGMCGGWVPLQTWHDDGLMSINNSNICDLLGNRLYNHIRPETQGPDSVWLLLQAYVGLSIRRSLDTLDQCHSHMISGQSLCHTTDLWCRRKSTTVHRDLK